MDSVSMAPAVSILMNDFLIPLLTAVAIAAAGVIATKVTQLLHQKLGTADVVAIQAAAGRAAGYGLSKLSSEISTSGILNINTKNKMVIEGVNYMNQMMPDAIKKLDLDQSKVQSMVEANLGQLLSASPSVVTPTIAPSLPPVAKPVQLASAPLTP